MLIACSQSETLVKSSHYIQKSGISKFTSFLHGMGAFHVGCMPIFVWVLIYIDVVVVTKMGAYIHGCLYSWGAYFVWVLIVPILRY